AGSVQRAESPFLGSAEWEHSRRRPISGSAGQCRASGLRRHQHDGHPYAPGSTRIEVFVLTNTPASEAAVCMFAGITQAHHSAVCVYLKGDTLRTHVRRGKLCAQMLTV